MGEKTGELGEGETGGEMYADTDTVRDIQTDRQTDRDRQIERETERQTDRETERKKTGRGREDGEKKER